MLTSIPASRLNHNMRVLGIPNRFNQSEIDSSARENYEGMTAFRDADGSTVIWLISDSNHMVWAQRTLLLKLRLKPKH